MAHHGAGGGSGGGGIEGITAPTGPLTALAAILGIVGAIGIICKHRQVAGRCVAYAIILGLLFQGSLIANPIVGLIALGAGACAYDQKKKERPQP